METLYNINKHHCPVCNSSDLECNSEYYDGIVSSRDWLCNNCGTTRHHKYRFKLCEILCYCKLVLPIAPEGCTEDSVAYIQHLTKETAISCYEQYGDDWIDYFDSFFVFEEDAILKRETVFEACKTFIEYYKTDKCALGAQGE